MRIIYGLGRAILGGFFVYNGLNHLNNTEALERYAASKQVPNPHAGVVVSGAVMTAAGAGLIVGVKPKISALGLLGTIAIATGQMHDFWNAQDEQVKQADLIQFSKNVALSGALLLLLGDQHKG